MTLAPKSPEAPMPSCNKLADFVKLLKQVSNDIFPGKENTIANWAAQVF